MQTNTSEPWFERMLADAENYRWLRDRNDWYFEPRIDEHDGTKWTLVFYTPARVEDPSDDDSLDAAIAAARAADTTAKHHFDAMSGAVRSVIAERRRQIEAEGWTPEHDDDHRSIELAFAASCYCVAYASSSIDPDYKADPPAAWPWDGMYWKPRDHRSNCVRAAALLLAEIERLDRAGKVLL